MNGPLSKAMRNGGTFSSQKASSSSHSRPCQSSAGLPNAL